MLGSSLFRFVAFLLGPGYLRFEGFSRGASFLLRFSLPTRLRGRLAGFRLRGQLGDVVLFALLGLNQSSFVFLLHLFVQMGFQITQTRVGLDLLRAKSLFDLGLGLRADGVQFRLPLLVALASFRLEKLFLLRRLVIQASLGRAHARIVDIALDFTGGTLEARERTVCEQNRIPGIFPTLVLQPSFFVASIVLDITVTVAITVGINPVQRCKRLRFEFAHQLSIA